VGMGLTCCLGLLHNHEEGDDRGKPTKELIVLGCWEDLGVVRVQ